MVSSIIGFQGRLLDANDKVFLLIYLVLILYRKHNVTYRLVMQSCLNIKYLQMSLLWLHKTLLKSTKAAKSGNKLEWKREIEKEGMKWCKKEKTKVQKVLVRLEKKKVKEDYVDPYINICATYARKYASFL